MNGRHRTGDDERYDLGRRPRDAASRRSGGAARCDDGVLVASAGAAPRGAGRRAGVHARLLRPDHDGRADRRSEVRPPVRPHRGDRGPVDPNADRGPCHRAARHHAWRQVRIRAADAARLRRGRDAEALALRQLRQSVRHRLERPERHLSREGRAAIPGLRYRAGCSFRGPQSQARGDRVAAYGEAAGPRRAGGVRRPRPRPRGGSRGGGVRLFPRDPRCARTVSAAARAARGGDDAIHRRQPAGLRIRVALLGRRVRRIRHHLPRRHRALPNIRHFKIISLVNTIALSPLLKLPKLETVRLSIHDGSFAVQNEAVRELLRQRGVDVPRRRGSAPPPRH